MEPGNDKLLPPALNSLKKCPVSQQKVAKMAYVWPKICKTVSASMQRDFCAFGTQIAPWQLALREGRSLVFQLRVPVLGLVDAAGLLGERVAGNGVGAGAGAAADLLVLAGAAFAFQLAGVAQRFENRRVAVDLAERRLADVARVDGQKAAGVDVAHMGDEEEALAVVDAAGGPTGGAGVRVGGGCAGLVGGGRPGASGVAVADFALFQVVLQEVAAVVHRLGGFDLEVNAVRKLVNLAEDPLEILAAQQVPKLAPSHGNEEENIPHHDGQPLEESAEAVQIMGVMAADGGVDLDGNARLVGPLDGLNGARISAGKAAKSVVNLRG